MDQGVHHGVRRFLERGNHTVEVFEGSSLGLGERELHAQGMDVTRQVHDVSEVGEVVLCDDGVDGERVHPTGEISDGRPGVIEGFRSHDGVMDGGRSAVQGDVDIAETSTDQVVDEGRVGESSPVGDEAEVQPQGMDLVREGEQMRVQGWLAAGEDDHGRAEVAGTLDLSFDQGGGLVGATTVRGMTEGAVVVAGAPNLDDDTHA
jgi:hypothetical protein